jgi:predicted PurR-regulated permease PerM
MIIQTVLEYLAAISFLLLFAILIYGAYLMLLDKEHYWRQQRKRKNNERNK